MSDTGDEHTTFGPAKRCPTEWVDIEENNASYEEMFTCYMNWYAVYTCLEIYEMRQN